MTYFSQPDENPVIVQTIQEHLQQLSQQLGQPHDADSIHQLYQAGQDLLNHLTTDPLTVARVAGVLLVYQLPDIDPDEAKWFKTQLSACEDAEAVEALIDSISRPDAL